jgi:hypothetical protein
MKPINAIILVGTFTGMKSVGGSDVATFVTKELSGLNVYETEHLLIGFSPKGAKPGQRFLVKGTWHQEPGSYDVFVQVVSAERAAKGMTDLNACRMAGVLHSQLQYYPRKDSSKASANLLILVGGQFIRAAAFSFVANRLDADGRYLKGAKVVIEGRLRKRDYVRNGGSVVTTEVVIDDLGSDAHPKAYIVEEAQTENLFAGWADAPKPAESEIVREIGATSDEPFDPEATLTPDAI